ncbi:MAG: GNAT family N-acetyltransferase [Candidatus Heimdallarchaeota archaeon]|nr:GNAT family N-acetyltransferase [Candidatus Heimdallarchaeota archaeon]MCK4955643.1 GNAT family N-acetyltransferase [Candidatus Heimdallarchaeota archaeon]
MFEVVKAIQNDSPGIRNLLTETDLVVEDIDEYIGNFLVIKDEEDNILACAGFEKYDDIGLLRSVAVSPELQGKGVGTLLTKSSIKHAKENGIRSLYLLTETAEKFFSKFSFKVLERDEAHPSIKNTYEFQYACVNTGILMLKNL